MSINIDSYLNILDKKSICINISSHQIDFNVIDLSRFIWLKEFECKCSFGYNKKNN